MTTEHEEMKQAMRDAFERTHPSKIPFKRGGSVFAETIPEAEYVDRGMQLEWELWQTSWNTAISQPPIAKAAQTIDLDKLAAKLHYPACWDTACFETLQDALDTILHDHKCTCDECPDRTADFYPADMPLGAQPDNSAQLAELMRKVDEYANAKSRYAAFPDGGDERLEKAKSALESFAAKMIGSKGEA